MRLREVPAIFEPGEFGQHRCFTILIAYVPADFQRLVQTGSRPVVIRRLAAQCAETAECAHQLVTVLARPQDCQRTFEVLACFPVLAQLRICFGKVRQGGSFTIPIASLPAKLQGLRI